MTEASHPRAAGVRFSQSHDIVDTHDFVELSIHVDRPTVANPFTDVRISGWLAHGEDEPVRVGGFADAQDGSLYKIRFMPRKTGTHRFGVTWRSMDGRTHRHEGTFEARRSDRRGMLRLDPDHPEHFIWEGTGEHCFWHGTTAYYLLGFKDDAVIRNAIDRLADLKVNRLRVLLYGRDGDMPWRQPVVNSEEFSMLLCPWPARFPDDAVPEFDFTRFNLEHWRKYEQLLMHARQRDMIVSVIFYIGAQELPMPFVTGGEDELRYYRYAVDRLAAFANVTWDLGNEADFHRDARWVHSMGKKVKFELDPYGHLLSAHNKVYHGPWIDMQLIQTWDRGQNAKFSRYRQEQAETGRVIPQINEEYGYEDLWEKQPGDRAADSRRRCAWELAMAGCYQTTGETTERGCGMKEDTGGGWVNGRGDASMTLLQGYLPMIDFFTALPWWRFKPNNDLVRRYQPAAVDHEADGQACALADSGRCYVFYLPAGGSVQVGFEAGEYAVEQFDPRTGQRSALRNVTGETWQSPELPGSDDWVFLFTRKMAERS